MTPMAPNTKKFRYLALVCTLSLFVWVVSWQLIFTTTDQYSPLFVARRYRSVKRHYPLRQQNLLMYLRLPISHRKSPAHLQSEQEKGEGGKRETTGVSSKAATVRPPLRIPQFERHLH